MRGSIKVTTFLDYKDAETYGHSNMGKMNTRKKLLLSIQILTTETTTGNLIKLHLSMPQREYHNLIF